MTTALLLSGGMDSVAIAYWQKPELAFTINYGQLGSQGEIHAAANVCDALGIQHTVIEVDCSHLGSGDLVGAPPNPLAPVTEWWPFRNQLLITLAGMRGVALGVKVLLFGSVQSDSIHVDGSEGFFSLINELVSFQEGKIRVVAPAIELTTTDLIRQSQIPLSLLGWSHSCHISDYACGSCRGCFKHTRVMRELGYEEN